MVDALSEEHACLVLACICKVTYLCSRGKRKWCREATGPHIHTVRQESDICLLLNRNARRISNRRHAVFCDGFVDSTSPGRGCCQTIFEPCRVFLCWYWVWKFQEVVWRLECSYRQFQRFTGHGLHSEVTNHTKSMFCREMIHESASTWRAIYPASPFRSTWIPVLLMSCWYFTAHMKSWIRSGHLSKFLAISDLSIKLDVCFFPHCESLDSARYCCGEAQKQYTHCGCE